MDDRISAQDSAAGHIDALEDLLGGLDASAPTERGITVYPQRVTRAGAAVSMSPSQALRYADDPTRVAAAEQTASPRHVVHPDVSLAELWSASGAAEPSAAPRPDDLASAPTPRAPADAFADFDDALPLPPPPPPAQEQAPAPQDETAEWASTAADDTVEWDASGWGDITWDDEGWEAAWDEPAPAAVTPSTPAAAETEPLPALDSVAPLAAPADPTLAPDAAEVAVEQADPGRADSDTPWWVAAEAQARPWWRRLLRRRS